MRRVLLVLALIALGTIPVAALAKGGPLHLFESQRQPVARAGASILATATKRVLGGVWSWPLSRSYLA
jgi:hypothetical protein